MIETNELVARLEKVEKQNRRMKVVGCAVLLVMTALLLVGWVSPESKVVEAETFVVKGADGNKRAELGMIEGCPTLALFNENGMGDVLLTQGKAGTGLILSDGKSPRAAFGIRNDVPIFNLIGKKGIDRIRITCSQEGPVLGIYDNDGKLLFEKP